MKSLRATPQRMSGLRVCAVLFYAIITTIRPAQRSRRAFSERSTAWFWKGKHRNLRLVIRRRAAVAAVAAALLGGFLEVVRQTSLPLRLSTATKQAARVGAILIQRYASLARLVVRIRVSTCL